MKPAVALRWMLRESRGARGRLLFFTACLAVGVAAVVGTAALSEAVKEGYRERSREILGADLTVDARRPLPPEIDDVLAEFPGSERSDVFETASMLRMSSGDASGRSRLARVHALTGRYPLHGELETEPPGGPERFLGAQTALAPRDLLDQLGAEVGDEVLIGGAPFRIAAEVVREPPSFGFSSFLGSRVYLSGDGLDRTQLLAFGTRATHRALIKLPDGSDEADLDRMVDRLEALPDAAYLDVDTHTEVGPGQGRTAQRLDAFLGLTALLSLVVGGIGVAQIVRAWVSTRTQAVAVMRCLGLRPVQILVISLGNVALLALTGSLLGVVVGLALPAVADAIITDLIPGGLPLVFPVGAVLRGLGLGIGIALVFSLPPLTAIWRVPPARVLRADAAPLPPPRSVLVLSALTLLAGVAGAAAVQSPRLDWGIAFTAGFVLLTFALWLGAKAMVALIRRLPRRKLHRYIAHGVAALARPGAGTAGAVVALGLGTMVVAATWIVQSRLSDGLLAQVGPDAPSVFLIDVQPKQVEGVREALTEARAEHVASVPVIMARVAAIDGVTIAEMAEDDGRVSRRLTREQRLTSLETLHPSNRVIDGELWSKPDVAEISVEERFARDMGIELGSTMEFDVQGVPLEVEVTSLRRVDWQSLSINFFLVLEPGVLEGAPALHLMSARVPSDAETGLQDGLAQAYPNVTVLRLGSVLAQITELLGRLTAGIAALGSFSALAGLFVLAGAAAATALRRKGEVALLKVLGVTRGGVALLLAIEFGIAGALAGLIGSAGAVVLAGGFLTYVADLDLGPPLMAIPVSMVLCALATAGCGLAASLGALRTRPIEALRSR